MPSNEPASPPAIENAIISEFVEAG